MATHVIKYLLHGPHTYTMAKNVILTKMWNTSVSNTIYITHKMSSPPIQGVGSNELKILGFGLHQVNSHMIFD